MDSINPSWRPPPQNSIRRVPVPSPGTRAATTMAAATSPDFQNQPGLEVSHAPMMDASGQGTQYYGVVKEEAAYVVSGNEYKYPVETQTQVATLELASAQQKARRNKWIAIGVGVLALIVVGGVLGGVLGSLHLNGGNGAKSSGTQPAGTQPTGPGLTGVGANGTEATTIRANSPLAATGAVAGSDYSIDLFFQGPDDKVWHMNYMTTFSNWSDPVEFTGSLEAPPSSPLAATTIFKVVDPGLPSIPQIEFFFENTQSQLSGQNWHAGYPSSGLLDSIDQFGVAISNGTNIASYWPSIALQSSNGTLLEIVFTYGSAGGFSQPQALPLEGSPASSLVLLPRETNSTAGLNSGTTSMRFLYRGTDGNLNIYDRASDGSQVATTGFPTIPLGATSALAGFATATESGNDVNTWILYQDDQGTINYIYDEASSGWEGPTTDSVFDGADNPTRISCVTAGTMGTPAVPLAATNDISSCFFQVDKKLKQVQFDGTKWNDQGFVPIP